MTEFSGETISLLEEAAKQRMQIGRIHSEINTNKKDQGVASGNVKEQIPVDEVTANREYSAINMGFGGAGDGFQKHLSEEQLLEAKTNHENYSIDSKSIHTITQRTNISKACDQEIVIENTNPFVDKAAAAKKISIQTSDANGDPLQTLKKGMLMSSYKQSLNLSGGVTSPSLGPDQSFTKAVGTYAGAKRP